MKFKILFAMALLAGIFGFIFSEPPFFAASLKNLNESGDPEVKTPHLDAGNFGLKAEIAGQFAPAVVSSQSAIMGITSHHLPLALPFIRSFYWQLAGQAGPRKIFIILGPDHFEKCRAPVTLSRLSYLTPFGELAVNDEVAGALLEAGVYEDNDCARGEHSAAAQAIFIRHFFPEAQIVPLFFSADTPESLVQEIADSLLPFADRAFIMASLDFSHYKNASLARRLDQESELMINNLETALVDLQHVDSPPSLKVMLRLAKNLRLSPGILGRANSADFNYDQENTTGYVNALFYEE